MATKASLLEWVVEALGELGGSGTVAEVCRVVWRRHEQELQGSGDLFYTWQYDIRWAAQTLRDESVLAAADPRQRRWSLKSSTAK